MWVYGVNNRRPSSSSCAGLRRSEDRQLPIPFRTNKEYSSFLVPCRASSLEPRYTNTVLHLLVFVREHEVVVGAMSYLLYSKYLLRTVMPIRFARKWHAGKINKSYRSSSIPSALAMAMSTKGHALGRCTLCRARTRQKCRSSGIACCA